MAKVLNEQNSQACESIFEELPNVLIQDAKNATSFFLPAEELIKFKSSNIEGLENTIYFLIPDGNDLDEVSFSPVYDNPSIVVKFPKGDSHFFIKFEELEPFKVKSFEQMTCVTDKCLTFIIPTGDEFLEDIPNMSPAMLQSGTQITELTKPIKQI
jgi:hypothetical protein